MVAAPMMQRGSGKLPENRGKIHCHRPGTVVVSVNRSGRIFLNSAETSHSELTAKLAAIFQSRAKKEVFLKADKDVPTGKW
jgi:biopolymer transport protein TolR